MAERTPRTIASIEDFAMTQDASKFAFKIVTTEGETFDFSLPTSEIGTLVQYFASQGAEMGRKRILDGYDRVPFPNELSPIPTEGIGISGTESEKAALIVMRLYAFELAFPIPSTSLAALAQKIAQTAELLSDKPTMPN